MASKINANDVMPNWDGNVPLVIDGHNVASETTFPVLSPLTRAEIWTCSSASKQNALDAVSAAQRAFPTWSKTKPSHRRDIFLRAADVILRRKDELKEYMRLEIGANEDYQEFIIGLAVEGLKDTAGRIAGAVQGQIPESNHDGMRAIIYKRPYGVVLGIAPWNAPYHLGLRSVTFALATGNTAILKGPELSPRCYWAIVDIFREAGLPKGCLNLVLHQPADAASAGQICMSTERILVHSSIASKFQPILNDAITRVFGTADTTPVIISSASAKRNRDLVAEAVSKGAEMLYAGNDGGATDHTDTRMAPAVVGRLDKSMKLYGTESFGPSVSVFSFRSEDEAIALANDTKYGLSAAIFTENLGTAFRIAEELESGAVHINSMTVHDEFALPHGGVKKSGFGRFNGYQGLEEFLYCKTVSWMQ
ncbi:hypothetical protein ACJZ2D_014827 [Fusarium nematophilum]